MNALLLASWIAAALVGGCGAATLLRARDRVALTPGLGAALVGAAFLLLGTSAGVVVQAWGAPLLVGFAGVLGLALARARGDCGCAEETCEGDPPRRRARAGTAAGLVLLAAAAWLFPVGSMRLDPGDAFLTQTAPLASQISRHGDPAVHPLGATIPDSAAAVARLLGALGGDPLETGQALAGAFQVLAVLALFGGLRAGTVHALAALLGVGAMLAGTPHSWLATTGLEGALAHLLGAGGLAVLLSASGAAAGAVVALLLLALSLVEPGVAWPLALLAAAAPWLPGTSACSKERHAQTGLALAACVGVFSLGGPPFPDLRFTVWTALLAVASWLAWRNRLRGPLVLAVGEVLVLGTGAGFGASVLAAGAVFATAGELLGRAWDHAAPGHWALRWRGELFLSAPWRALIAVAVLFLVVQGFEPGETALNRNVLLAGQKKQLSVQQLFAPLPLEDWVRTRGADFGLQPGDVERAAALRARPAVVVTVGVEREPLLPSAVIATLAGTPLPGWRVTRDSAGLEPGGWRAELEPAVELARRRAARQAAVGERLLLRQPLCAEEGPTIATGPTDEPFAARWKGVAAPGSVVEIEVSPPVRRGEVLGYQVTRDGEAWSRIPVETPAGRPVLFPVPRTPGGYLLHFFRRSAGAPASKATDLGDGGLPKLVSDEPGALRRLQVQASGLGVRLPSRSLVPFELVLRNPSQPSDRRSESEPTAPDLQPVSLARFEALRLELEGADAYPEERRGRLQPLVTSAGLPPGGLEPGTEVRLRVVLPTPLTEGTFRARPVLVDAEGGSVPLDLEIPFRTWRRIPPGGAW